MITRLYPATQTTHERLNLYLGERLHEIAAEGETFVYTNYVSSVDGRIATKNDSGELGVPQGIGNEPDWRLFQELAAQADILLVSSRHMRLVNDDPDEYMGQFALDKFADLADWRVANGLARLPDTAVISRSLDFTIHPSLVADGRKVLVFTSGDGGETAVSKMTEQGAEVIICGDDELDSAQIPARLAERGYRSAYITFGPHGLHAMLQAGIVQRLYLTLAHRLIAGDPFQPLTLGKLLDPPLDLELRTIYFDAEPLDGSGQLYLSYNVQR